MPSLVKTRSRAGTDLNLFQGLDVEPGEDQVSYLD
jgi:hypothetical protein